VEQSEYFFVLFNEIRFCESNLFVII
jgi:hypothetical protein